MKYIYYVLLQVKVKKQQRIKDMQTRIKLKAEKQQSGGGNFNPDNIADMEDSGNLELDDDDLALMAAAQNTTEGGGGEVSLAADPHEGVKYSKSPVRKSETESENVVANSSSSSLAVSKAASAVKIEEKEVASRKVGCANCVIV